MDYEIVATLGPASPTAATWQSMLTAGATAFRLNTSHLSLPQLKDWIDRIGPFLNSTGSSPALVLDLQGSKWRLGEFNSFDIHPGQTIELVYAEAADRPGVLPVPHADFFLAASNSSGKIVLNDAKILLSLEKVQPDVLTASAVHGGEISPRKGITFGDSEYRLESLNEKDQAIFERTRGFTFVRYALSYVKDAGEMKRYREILGPEAYLIAKIERRPAVEDAIDIAQTADELWLCRGDLGAELGLAAMAEAVHRFTGQLRQIPVPVLMAGQLLEHMASQPAPTRSEVCYLYDTLHAGYRGFVLSDETAMGRYPVESCSMAALFKNSTNQGT